MSVHSNPAFMVRNHSEQKRRKVRMIINYKSLNEYIKFDGYFIHRKDVLINLVKDANFFSKLDCKSGYWQVMLIEESRPLTTFSTSKGHFQ